MIKLALLLILTGCATKEPTMLELNEYADLDMEEILKDEHVRCEKAKKHYRWRNPCNE